MNVYELEKLATPGPLVVQGIEDKRSSIDAILTAFTPKFRNPRYVARVYGQGVFSNLCEERDANAKLLAHCHNNFMRALEALKVQHRSNMGDGEYGFQHSRTGCKCCELIAELEEV